MPRVRHGAFLACLLLAACTSPRPEATQPARLQAGLWTGGLTPMNHPDMVTPLTYEVAYPDDGLAIVLNGPGGTAMVAREAALQDDTLRFVFEEPEEGVTLRCALGAEPTGSFAGRCTDPGGQWARFTMVPPAE